jgi:hypothetical protein
VFTLNTTTGEIIDPAARASWSGAGEGQITAAPFASGDVVAMTNSPVGYVTLLGLDQGLSVTALNTDNVEGHEYSQQLSEVGDPTQSVASACSQGQKLWSHGFG